MAQLSQVVRTILSLATFGWVVWSEILGLAWFWGGFTQCERTVLAVPAVGLVASAIAFLLNHVSVSMAAVLGVPAIAGIAALASVAAGSDFPCGIAVPTKADPISLALLVIGIAWMVFRLSKTLARSNSTPHSDTRDAGVPNQSSSALAPGGRER